MKIIEHNHNGGLVDTTVDQARAGAPRFMQCAYLDERNQRPILCSRILSIISHLVFLLVPFSTPGCCSSRRKSHGSRNASLAQASQMWMREQASGVAGDRTPTSGSVSSSEYDCCFKNGREVLVVVRRVSADTVGWS